MLKLLNSLSNKNFLYYINFQNNRFLNDMFNLYNLNYYFLNIIINIIVCNNNYILFLKIFIHL